MPRRKKPVNKQNRKRADKRCKFCGADDYCVLDVHRIVPGEEGGEYVDLNVVTCCSNCHRKVHEGAIRVDRMYYSTKGWLLHWWDEKGVEHWD